ncbi:MAG: LysR family transcriptional regulator [Rhizobacter sp.]|nr:LysR family transcriptional regulator [Rhizobacter sp.]
MLQNEQLLLESWFGVPLFERQARGVLLTDEGRGGWRAGRALASLQLIERDIAMGRLVCPLASPMWRAPDYTLVANLDRARDPAVIMFERWIKTMVDKGPADLRPA